jgi:hypothetical protein
MFPLIRIVKGDGAFCRTGRSRRSLPRPVDNDPLPARRTERNLDALQFDDQVSTGQQDAVWAACQHLADAARR